MLSATNPLQPTTKWPAFRIVRPNAPRPVLVYMTDIMKEEKVLLAVDVEERCSCLMAGSVKESVNSLAEIRHNVVQDAHSGVPDPLPLFL